MEIKTNFKSNLFHEKRFNMQIKKLSDSILISENSYKDTIFKINDQW